MQYYTPDNLTYQRVEGIINALPRSRNKDYLNSAKQIIDNNVYLLPPFGRVKFPHLIDWKDNRSRSFSRLLHGFTFLGCLTDAFIETKNPIFIEKSLELINDWIKIHNYEVHKETMAYHDETTAVRMQYLLRFFIVTREYLLIRDSKRILNEMEITAKLLLSDKFHATNTNHGMFQDIALLLYGLYFTEKKGDIYSNYISVAVKRLKDYFEDTFTTDGVHKEHSPAYHLMVASSIKRLVVWMEDIDSNIAESFKQILANTESYSTHIIRPDGYIPQIADTELKPIIDTSYKNLYSSDSYKYAVTSGREGIEPNEESIVFKDAGYAIFRDSWCLKEKATYIVFMAAYNANYHKHSDDLNLLIYKDGEIISEAGPNGYNYKEPHTRYAYSSFAHNTLIVDGISLPRVDGKFDQVYIEDYSLDNPDMPWVTGVNNRYEGVTHKRKVIYQKNKEIIKIEDEIISEDRHHYQLLWHVAQDVKIQVRDKFVEFFRNEIKIMELEIQSDVQFNMSSVSGQMKPEVKGWSFPKMEHHEPQEVIEIQFMGKSCNLNLEFRLHEESFVLGRRVPFKLENVYQSTKDIRYKFIEAEDKKYKDKLLVIFSTTDTENKFVYEHVSSLEEIKANKLFILDDFGNQGSYYLGQNQDFSIEASVSSLINFIMAKYKISHDDVITIGSSKGGFAALYFGIKYHYGNVIVGGPQTKIGDFLITQTSNAHIASYISGGSLLGDKFYLNDLLYRLLKQPIINTKIHLLCGTDDLFYKNHVVPFVDTVREKGISLDYELVKNINHNDLKLYFPIYIVHKIKKIMGEESILSFESLEIDKGIKFSCKQVENKIIIKCDLKNSSKKLAYYVYCNGTCIFKQHYSNSKEFEYEVSKSGTYQIKIFIRDENLNVDTKLTNKITIK